MSGATSSHLKLLAPTAEDARLVRLVTTHAGLLDALEVVDGAKELQLITRDGAALRGSNTICKYIAQSSAAGENLLGGDDDGRALVAQWLSTRYSMLSPVNEEGLQRLDDALLSRTFLLGTTLSLADLVLFGFLHRAVKSFPSAQLGRLKNIVRWYDYLQHVADPRGIFPKVPFKRPRLSLAPPAVAAPQQKDASAAPAAKQGGAAVVGTPAAAGPPAGPASAAPAAPPKAAAASAQPAPAPAAKAEKKEKAAAAGPASKDAAAAEPGVDALDIRVGQIVKVEQHPNAESLYVEEIDVGEEKPRQRPITGNAQVVSGLVKFVPLEKMLHRPVMVLLNLKPAKMRDVVSSGMVLCASNATHDQVDPICPPEGAAVGERVTFEGYSGEPEPQLNPKKKVFEKLAPNLTTNADGVAVFKGVPMMTSKGPVTASIPNAHVK